MQVHPATLSIWDLVKHTCVCLCVCVSSVCCCVCACVGVWKWAIQTPQCVFRAIVSFKDAGQTNRHLTQANFTYGCHDNRKQTEDENTRHLHNDSSEPEKEAEICHLDSSFLHSLSLSLYCNVFVFTFTCRWLNFLTSSLSYFSPLPCLLGARGGRAWKQSSSWVSLTAPA